jgi:uncharacterized protein
MAVRYLAELFSPEVQAAQATYYGRAHARPSAGEADALGPDEVAFIAERDSFYLGTVSPSGWPYVQHRGGPLGFLRVLTPSTLAFGDLKGNRQLLSTGHLAASDKVSLFLMDYPNQTRLKVLGHAQVMDARAEPELVAQLKLSAELQKRVERVFRIDVVSFDWNCPAYITPRYTAEEVKRAVAPLHARVAELEAELARLRGD